MSSDLRILVLGQWNDTITAVGNALLGREVFDKDKYQRHSVNISDKRELHVTCVSYGEQVYMKDDEWFLCDELVTEINTTVYHAVVFAMEIKPLYLIPWYPNTAELMMRDTCWKDFVRKKGVIVVREAKTFNEGRSTGEITGSFLDWMKGQGSVVGSIFQEVQERCALFDTSGTLDVFAKQRDDLVHMIDTRILGGGYYTDIKFQESQLRSVELEKQLTESIKDMGRQLEELRKELVELKQELEELKKGREPSGRVDRKKRRH